jgi:hypothetical protein
MEVAMKNALQFSFLSLLFIFFTSAEIHSQTYQGMYMHIDYIQVSSDNESSFRDMIRSSAKPIMNARKQNGKVHSWYLYRVAYPGMPNSSHNYIVITISDALSGFEDVDEQIAGQLSSRDRERMFQNYRRFMKPTHTEVWRIQNSVVGSDASKPSRYMVMNYMNVGLGYEYEYQMMEDEVARPLHEQRMDNGQMVAWELNSLIIPGGTSYGHNFSTIDFYDKLEHMEFGFTEELIRQTHPDTNINEFFQNIYRTRDLVRSEVWELVESL